MTEHDNISSGEHLRSDAESAEIAARIAAALEEEPAKEAETELSPVFKELREPKLPALPKENRARLLMQTPTRIYFYWGLKNNPYQILQRAFGDNRGSYTLVLKLVNVTRGTEEIHPVDAEGNYWFNVDPDSTYRAEVGFYAPNRPYFRALYSNTVTTPRKSPSPRAATDADWSVSADDFAQVLDNAGFQQDAFELGLAGDDAAASDAATRAAFTQFVGEGSNSDAFTSEELRYAMLALASGVPLEELRWKISASLFALLAEHLDHLSSESAMSALRDHFEIEDEIVVEVQLSAVHGASLVHFPKTIKRRRLPDMPSSNNRRRD